MLNSPAHQRGFTVVELIITMLVVAILVGTAAPNIGIWIQNARIRTTADAILNGLQMARAEGVKRNTSVRFQLTDSLTNACSLSPADSNWVVSLNDASGRCANPPVDPPPSPAPADPANPYIIQSRSSAEGSTSVVVAADQPVFVFNGLGRLTPAPAGNLNINLSNPTAGACVGAGGVIRCLRITVTVGGLIRMCNPAAPASNPQGC